MQKESQKKKEWLNTGRQMAWIFMILVFLTVVGVSAFLKIYSNYNDEVLYAERLNQMQEVTEQLFAGLEDVVDVQWDEAQYQCNYLKQQAPSTVDEMLQVMRQQSSLKEMDRKQTELIAIDAQGRYYFQDGKQGLLSNMSYLDGTPERLSYVFNDMTVSRARMLFLYYLEEPVSVEDDRQTTQIIYYGIAVDMERLTPYFDCKAYNGNNSTYVVDTQGLKLFSGSDAGEDPLGGFNVFSVLRNMNYLHDSSFDDTLRTMQETGLSYSNAILNGEEYYYAMYRMKNADWILLFLVPSRYVATNTVALVDNTTKMLMIFAVFMIVVFAVLIYIVLRMQQQKALQIAEEANAVLEENNRKLEQAQAETAKALQVAESASKAKTEFLANMSHDIRTPMNAIVGITKLMAHDKDHPDKMNDYIAKVQMSSQHLLSLINDVLDMSKIESSEVVLNKELINLADQISQVESIARPQIEEREQNFAIHIHNITHEHLIGDAVRLRQVIINLLSNAIKYTPNGGNIRLDLEELPCETADHTTLRIVVTDSGYGMTPEFLQHVYEPFTRAENSTTNRVQGTGLGMAITRNIVDLAGGSISVRSEVNKGSCFTVELPLLIDHETKTTLPVHSVLLITDDDEFIGNVRAAFRETDVMLTVAQSEAEADAALRDKRPEAALLGSCLKGQTLVDNIHRLRDRAGNILLFYCCDYNDRDQVSDLTGTGEIDAVIIRPFFLSDLGRVIERSRNREKPELPETASVLKGMRFLCAEDNALNAEILQAILDMKGASCVIYPDGQKIVEAFKSVKPQEFDAILMDVQMPVMNGLDATRLIRKSENPLGRTIPIIAMTANAFSEDVQNCLNAGMDVHISKPIDVVALERTMKSFVNGRFFGGGGQLSAQRRHNGNITEK